MSFTAIALCLLALSHAPAPFPRPPKPDPGATGLKALAGRWRVDGSHGGPLTQLIAPGDVCAIDDTRLHIQGAEGYSKHKFFLKLHAKGPTKRMALLRTARSFDLPPCVYHLDGGLLVLRFEAWRECALPGGGCTIILRRLPLPPRAAQ